MMKSIFIRIYLFLAVFSKYLINSSGWLVIGDGDGDGDGGLKIGP